MRLPYFHHKLDREFIMTQLKELPRHWREQVAEAYSDKYKETLYGEPNENKRDNLARKTANNWLRGYVERYKKRYLQRGGNSA